MSRCVLCGRHIATRLGENNPWPCSDEGVCCDRCNSDFVIPARIARLSTGDIGGTAVRRMRS